MRIHCAPNSSPTTSDEVEPISAKQKKRVRQTNAVASLKARSNLSSSTRSLDRIGKAICEIADTASDQNVSIARKPRFSKPAIWVPNASPESTTKARLTE